MATPLILIAAVPLLAGLLFFEKRGSIPGLLFTKPFLSALFITAALAGPHPETVYFRWILAGLFLCMAGDVCLIFFFQRKAFLGGLVAFLAGHVCYTVAFFTLAGGAGSWVFIALTLAVSAGVFFKLRPHLGKMVVPVFAYVVIITAMVIGAAALAATETLRFQGRVFALWGALFFYVSDIFVARHRFVAQAFANRAAGLPLYFAGQFLIAFSIRWI
jgi:uncharacterized membrane protein YhhN